MFPAIDTKSLVDPVEAKAKYLNAIRYIRRTWECGLYSHDTARNRIQRLMLVAITDPNVDLNMMSEISTTGSDLFREIDGTHLGYTTCGCPSPSPQTHDLYTLTQVGFWLKRLCEGKEIAIKTTLPLEFIEGIKETQKLLKEREELCKKMDDISKLISK